MKTRFYSILCAALVLGTVSCSKEVSPVVEEKPAVVSLTAGFDDVKTTVANDGKVAWAEGDQLWVKCGSETAIFTLDPADAGKNVGKFTTTSVMDFTVGSNLEAYYPAEVGNSGSPVWPAEQTYSENMGCPMHATATIATEGTAPQLSFKNLGSILRLSIGTSQAGKKVRSIIVSSTTPLAGAFSVDADGKAVISGTQTAITLDCGEEGIEIGTTPKTINVAIPANATSAVYEDFAVAVNSTDDTFAESLAKDLTKSLERNKVYDNNTFAAATFTEIPSNCYIVAPNTTRTINAMHMGHSLKAADRLEGVVGAELLWETVNTTEAPAQNSIITDLSYANGLITFTTGSIPGNAYIVAKDSESNTVWGWHIWVVEGGVVPTLVSADGLTEIMNYDLGSVAVDGFPLLYQSGRHCPVWGICGTLDSPVDMGMTPSAPSELLSIVMPASKKSEVDRYGSTSGLEFSIAHSGTWLDCGDPQYWSDDRGDGFWVKTKYKVDNKSIFDPCPDGYRIPTGKELEQFLASTALVEESKFVYDSGWIIPKIRYRSTFGPFKNASCNGYTCTATNASGSCLIYGPDWETGEKISTNYKSGVGRRLRCVRY